MAGLSSLIGNKHYLARVLAPVLALLAFNSPGAFGQQAFRDPLDHPAETQNAIAQRSLMAIAKAGSQLVAVGSRGLIIRSSDNGKTWVQVRVPVQSDLLAVSFPSASDGWAVGHDGVILNTRDGGQTWLKQLDGRAAADSFKKFYADADADPAMQAASTLVAQNFKAGPALPYLGVWFDTVDRGFAVGSFGMIVATIDGGKTWEPWMHRIDNDKALNLNSIRGIGQNIYVVGERGTVYVLDRSKGRFRSTETGYGGSFFGIAGMENTLLAFGLRGVVYRSLDGGIKWSQVKMPAESAITSGAARTDIPGFILVNSAGRLLVGDAQGVEFKLIAPANPMRFTDMLLGPDGSLVTTGVEGVRVEPLDRSAK